jgi:mannose-1-phosphate guanylyltransferase/mannose-6-phosphate isomerase
MTITIHPVILCGGSGTRLWPLSTPETPKQFKALTSSKSMIEETADRFSTSSVDSIQFTPPLVIGSKKHAHLLERALPRSPKILEPCGRNSAPAIAAACLSFAPEDLILILPADHSIRDVPAFHQAIAGATRASESGAIVTFGIAPNYPAIDYGYIKVAAPGPPNSPIDVEKFVEKPELEVAKRYLTDGRYYWNAGIFLFKAQVMLDELGVNAPKVLAGVRAAMPASRQNVQYLDAEEFAKTPSISIDYAVMEKSTRVQTVPVDMAWSDVGGYASLHELLAQSSTENYTQGPVLVENSKGMYIRSDGPAIAVNGVSDLVIVATKDEVMISPKDDAQAVKSLGANVQRHRHALGLPKSFSEEIRDWLWTAFDVWANAAWDEIAGGFVEKLNLQGQPDLNAERRVRVQARQVFSFAKAIEIGWPGADRAQDLVRKGVNYIDSKLRHPDGGWVHIVHRDGTPADNRRDLYDHALLIFAGSVAYEVTGNKTALKIAEDAISFIDSALKDDENGGWFESIPPTTPRRANPHMHLLEAMLAFHSATGRQDAMSRAAEIVRLFETRFFNPANDVMAEFFTNDWQVETSESETVFEPGHHYEWATLLYHYESLTGHDTGSWRRRLIHRADTTGLNSETKFARNVVRADGEIVDGNSRLWHQLEKFRTQLVHYGTKSPTDPIEFLLRMRKTFLDTGPAGGWVDEVDATNRPVAKDVPASMLYHLAGGLSVLIK